MRPLVFGNLIITLTALLVFSTAWSAPNRGDKSPAFKKSTSVAQGVKRGRKLESKSRTTKSSAVAGKRRGGFQRVVYAPSLSAPSAITAGDLAGLGATRDPLDLSANVALVIDQSSSEVLFEKNSQIALPIASITKLMTSLVVVEANQNLDELLTVTEEDVDRKRYSHSRLRIGSQLSRANMLHIALMSSENRAAAALGRHYPGGLPAFISAMNAKAAELGMTSSRFADPTGLSSANVSSARDLSRLVVAAYQHPLIREYSTDSHYAVEPGGVTLEYRNSNGLIENPEWAIGLQKTGYIAEAGRCLVMQVNVAGRQVVMVFLDSKTKQSRLADADRIRKWLENRAASAMSQRQASSS
jgi:D-alanyl-D-alanine endopeptidase (penicillin-binding protein 7)